MAIKIAGTEVINDNKRVLNNESLPDVRPSLLLDFANSKTLDPRITFTRGSTATYWDGKTTAKAEENLVQRSQEFDNGYWAKGGTTVTSNNTISPDGTTTAEKVEITTEGPYRNISRSITAFASATYTFSVYLKAGNYNYVGAQIQSRTSANAYINTAAIQSMDLSTGSTVGSTTGSSVITDVGNGWYRLEITGTLSSNAATAFVDIIFTDSSGQTAPSPSVASGSYVYAWGAQLEQRSSATAYTATTDIPIVKYQPVLQTAASGEARFDHDPVTGESKGLLIEEARTNLIPYSEDLSQWLTVGSPTILTNQVVAPDGTLTADTVDDTNTTGPALVYVLLSSMTAVTNYTASVYLKAGTSDICTFNVYRGAIENNLNIDLSDGTFVNEPSSTSASDYVSHSIEHVGNGWYRVSVTFNCDTAGQSIHFRIWPKKRDIHPPTGYVHVWGAQLEEGSFPTSYIPTSGSTVTRAVEQVTMTNIAPELNGQEGTLYVEATPPNYNTGDQRLVSIGASGSDVVEMFREYGSRNFQWAVKSVSGSIGSGSTSWAADTTAKFVLGYKSGDNAVAADGSLIITQSGTFAAVQMNQMLIGRTFVGGASAWSGEIKKIAYYPKRLSNATLQAMTAD